MEDLSLCISEDEIIEIAKKHEVNIPKDIVDENEEALCDTTAPIGWNRFYEVFNEWSKDYAVKRSQSLTDYGNEDEVIEVANELFTNDIDGASKFIHKALDYGVRFQPDNLIKLPLLCNRETVEMAVLSSCISFDQNDLEVLYGNIDDKIIEIAAKKYNLKLPEDMQENYDEYIDSEPMQADQPTKKLGGFFSSLFGRKSKQTKEPIFTEEECFLYGIHPDDEMYRKTMELDILSKNYKE